MSAITDKWLKATPLITDYLAGAISNATATTFTITNGSTDLENGEVYEVTIDKVDTDGDETGRREVVVAQYTSATKTFDCTHADYRGVEGVAQGHPIGSVVQVLATAHFFNQRRASFLTAHNQDGSHKADLAFTTPVLTAPSVKNLVSEVLTTAGGTTTYTLTPSTAITAYATGQEFSIKMNASNTGASTINISGLGAKSLTKGGATALASGDLLIDGVYKITYDGTQFQVSGIGGSAATVATQAEVATGTDNTKVTTPLAVAPYANSSMTRQAIINGNFDVWQRGTSFVSAASATQYGPDRWQIYSPNTNVTFSRQTADVNGSAFSLRAQRNNANAGTDVIYINYTFESKDSIKFRGKTLTMSFQAKKGANFSDAASAVSIRVVTGTGTDQNVATGFTGGAYIYNSSQVITTTTTGYSLTTTACADTTTQIGFQIFYTPTGTAGANDWFEVTQVQLSAGSVALQFQPKSYAQELQDCLRYCFVPETSAANTLIGIGHAFTTTASRIVVNYPVIMRIAPALTATAGDWALDDTAAAPDVTAINLTDDATWCSNKQGYLRVNVASGLTQWRVYGLRADNTANRVMIFSSEL